MTLVKAKSNSVNDLKIYLTRNTLSEMTNSQQNGVHSTPYLAKGLFGVTGTGIALGVTVA
jgi:hypothetical protein